VLPEGSDLAEFPGEEIGIGEGPPHIEHLKDHEIALGDQDAGLEAEVQEHHSPVVYMGHDDRDIPPARQNLPSMHHVPPQAVQLTPQETQPQGASRGRGRLTGTDKAELTSRSGKDGTPAPRWDGRKRKAQRTPTLTPVQPPPPPSTSRTTSSSPTGYRGSDSYDARPREPQQYPGPQQTVFTAYPNGHALPSAVVPVQRSTPASGGSTTRLAPNRPASQISRNNPQGLSTQAPPCPLCSGPHESGKCPALNDLPSLYFFREQIQNEPGIETLEKRVSGFTTIVAYSDDLLSETLCMRLTTSSPKPKPRHDSELLHPSHLCLRQLSTLIYPQTLPHLPGTLAHVMAKAIGADHLSHWGRCAPHSHKEGHLMTITTNMVLSML